MERRYICHICGTNSADGYVEYWSYMNVITYCKKCDRKVQRGEKIMQDRCVLF